MILPDKIVQAELSCLFIGELQLDDDFLVGLGWFDIHTTIICASKLPHDVAFWLYNQGIYPDCFFVHGNVSIMVPSVIVLLIFIEFKYLRS